MLEIQSHQKVHRGRLFPEIQWTEDQKHLYRDNLENHHQRCRVIFERLQPELIKNHYNWFMAVDSETGDYFIDQNEEVVTQMCLQKHPNAIPFIFVINETGVAGKI
ncbi:hypothetical protein WJM97_11875 [Okeanomitos corallinicola TIOX110]|uniref:Uncharacterized protein n=1 Tax=Okeanomitos corallinicola TIOX110 TaxID=3133117 RepID=A0ABZ2URC8_9CYAN